jgi:hypothetical protein
MAQEENSMSNGTPYYKPYDSGTEDDESDDESSEPSDPSDGSDYEDPRIRREQDPRFAIIRAAGSNQKSSDKQNDYMSHLPGAPWDETTNIKSFKDHVYLDPPKTTKTSLVSIKSNNRDKNVFPTPFKFQLKLPRVYKNVTKFQLVQMSFPNNAQNVSASELFETAFVQKILAQGVPISCISTCVNVINCVTMATGFGMIEQGRMNQSGAPLVTTMSVPNGSYSDTQLAAELTFRANNTPPLNIIPYSEFSDIFQNTRDISVLFNEPGDNFCSNINNTRHGVHSKDHIMSCYYTQAHLDSLPEITDKIAFNAYYYPILKELIATGRMEPFLNTNGIPLTEVTDRVLGMFEGLDSDFYYKLSLINQGMLDSYRKHLTFELRHINKYRWVHNAAEKRFVTMHDSLHTSLHRDLTKNHTLHLQHELTLAGLNVNSFRTLKTNLISYNSIYKHLERNLSTAIGQYYLLGDYSYGGGPYHNAGGSTFHAINDLDADLQFTTMFSYTSTIGRIYGNYAGTIMEFSTFSDYHSTMSSYYFIVESTTTAVNGINSRTNAAHHEYVSNKYSGIFPDSMISNQSYLSNQAVPMSFLTNDYLYVPGQSILASQDTASPVAAYTITQESSCMDICCDVVRKMVSSWYSCLPTNLTINTLPYRLGIINMEPMKFSIFSTIAQLTSTGNLNFFMQINENQGFNNIDVTMRENYMISNETTGQVKLMAGKILMGSIGDTGVSQTVIQNPTIFETTLGKLDKLDFKIYYDDENITPAWLYMPYHLDVDEWNATFQIDEQVAFANPASGWGMRPTIDIPNDPSKSSYIFLTHKDNPNNT